MKENNIFTEKFTWRSRLKSFQYAFDGIVAVFNRDHNLLLHLAGTFFVAGLAVIFQTTPYETIVLVFAIGLVWISELFNTAIEKSMDLISSSFHPRIKFIKDVSAAAVLVAAITAAIAGSIIFIPKILVWLGY